MPDLSNPKIREELAQEAREITRRDRESNIMAEIDALTDDLLASLPPHDWDEEPQK